MTRPTVSNKPITNHRMFARIYELSSRGLSESKFMEPLREETVGQARGLVLEIGAGNGLNFSFYDPEKVERVEAIEPDSAMLRYARQRIEKAHVPINLTQAAVETLPFADGMFDSVVATLVFCSVTNPLQGLHEMRRVLKPEGTLFMVEHVRSHGVIAARVQDIVTPVTRLVSGNCHWNRDTVQDVSKAGFSITYRRDIAGTLLPMVVLRGSPL